MAVDLAAPDAMSRIADATAGIDIGMVFYCAGADPNYQPFLAQPVDAALAMVQRNCVVPLQVFHHFAGPMVERGGVVSCCCPPAPASSAPRTWSPTAVPRPSTS